MYQEFPISYLWRVCSCQKSDYQIADQIIQFASTHPRVSELFSLQKGFLTGINGTAEHILTITAIIDNSIKHGIPLAVTFVDLQSTFGSVAHALITDILARIKLPSGLISYILDGYTKLSATVKTKEWKTPQFEIKRGMLQGDTLSPVIFLTVFNPPVELSNHLLTCRFSLKVPVRNSVVLFHLCTLIWWTYWLDFRDGIFLH